MAKRLTAAYTSRCVKCGGTISPGTEIEYQKGTGSWHADKCPEKTAPAAIPADAITVSQGRRSRPLQSEVGAVFRHRQHGPLTVLAVSGQYIREDGLSFGLSDDSGWLATLTCRKATDEERAELEKREAARDARVAEEKRVRDERRALEELFRTGTRPEGDHLIEGEEIPVDTRTRIYGGGSWFIIEPAAAAPPSAEEIEAVRLAIAPELDAQAAYQAFLAWQHVSNADWTLFHAAASGARIEELPEEGRALATACAKARATSKQIRPSGFWGPELVAWQKMQGRIDRATHGRRIWHVVNNGADGDCWGNNNVLTGGAGAVGHWLPWSAELEARVRSVREQKEAA